MERRVFLFAAVLSLFVFGLMTLTVESQASGVVLVGRPLLLQVQSASVPQTFNPPLQLQMLWTANDLTAAGVTSADANTFSVYRYDTKSQTWQSIGGQIDTVNDIITANISSAGTYSIGLVNSQYPQISITSPTSLTAYWTTASKFSISGTASANSSVASVRWTNNRGGNGTCSGTSSWSATGIALSSGENLITVTVSDTSGLQTNATLSVYYEPSPVTLSGLAMVSCPIIPSSSDPKQVFNFDGSYWYAYQPSSNTYAAYPDKSTWFTPVGSAVGRGFWAKFASQTTPPSGAILAQDQPVTIHLLKGWNIIGQPFVTSLKWDTSAIRVNPGSSGTTASLSNSSGIASNFAWSWNATRNAYDLITDPTFSYGDARSLSPWHAYWIKAYADCDLILPAPGN